MKTKNTNTAQPWEIINQSGYEITLTINELTKTIVVVETVDEEVIADE